MKAATSSTKEETGVKIFHVSQTLDKKRLKKMLLDSMNFEIRIVDLQFNNI